MWETFKSFLLLGMTSFGGPVAHLGYFHRAFVVDKKWLSDSEFSRLLALCQFLPGPASSQLGFAIGYQHSGLGGALVAFVGFTLPSFLLMWGLAVFALDSATLQDSWSGVIHGLKLLAVVVVADAVLGMYRKFCQSLLNRLLCFLSAVLLLLMPGIWSQLIVILMGASIGWIAVNSAWVNSSKDPAPANNTNVDVNNGSRDIAMRPLFWFLGLMLFLPVVSGFSEMLGIARDFYLAGSWVFGGGHVVLPLLQGLMGDAVSQDQFLTGYAAAQAVPGPMFTMVTYLGAIMNPEHAFLGAIVATLAVFLPGFLLVLALQRAWLGLSGNRSLQTAIAGINAAVVGLLASALYSPVFVSAVDNSMDLAIVVSGFYLLRFVHVPLIYLVAGMAGVGMML